MKHRILESKKAPSAIGPYSQGVALESGLHYISGQLPINEKGELLDEIESATKQSLENIVSILNENNLNKENIFKINIFMRDLNDFEKMNKAYNEFFKHNFPARSALQVCKLPKNAIIEIEAIAI